MKFYHVQFQKDQVDRKQSIAIKTNIANLIYNINDAN